ncbi:ABC transporter substrate-binding protein [Vibrio sp. S11_S32]|uniref:ABC transporter substrate-binding protein n=1 Tax=Vibrio sp. S11_S32 TaxID=2720225 RepID=UPI001680558D|nr:ABC transporter substrate-binding protein [Vibrio sp. S11_S32]MBD1576722.1 ABC transporter substrate-binding protein [Vibrio sp. S11_S32]
MKGFLFVCLLAVSSTLSSFSASANDNTWSDVETKAKGQNVYFNAWGGSQEINQYLRWVGIQVKQQYGVNLHHVKVTDIAETTARLIAEKAAGKDQSGSVDMVWINGENFKSMKQNHLLLGPFVHQLPNWTLVDKTLPVEKDFSEPTLGLEAPWGVGQLVFIYDKNTLNQPPTSAQSLLRYAKAHPGKVTYPKPPQFHGTSFLKALLIELASDPTVLNKPVEEVDFATVTAPLWAYLDQLHPVAWKQGKQFPINQPELIQMLDDGQIDMALTFNPNEVFSAQAAGKLATTTSTFAWQSGALSNIHFLAIPWNAASKEGALVVINFLLSPAAQSHKGDLDVWGDPSVLQAKHLMGDAKKTQLFPSVAEPHPSWQSALEQAWLQRYGQ